MLWALNYTGFSPVWGPSGSDSWHFPPPSWWNLLFPRDSDKAMLRCAGAWSILEGVCCGSCKISLLWDLQVDHWHLVLHWGLILCVGQFSQLLRKLTRTVRNQSIKFFDLSLVLIILPCRCSIQISSVYAFTLVTAIPYYRRRSRDGSDLIRRSQRTAYETRVTINLFCLTVPFDQTCDIINGTDY